jgi:Flp pilus assembly protein TadG
MTSKRRWLGLSNGGTGPSFVVDVAGVAAIEFAFLAPIVITMLAIVVLGGEGFTIQRKVALAARTVTDLVSQSPYVKNASVSGATELNQSDLDTDEALSAEILYPYDPTNLQVVVSELSVNTGNNTGTVVWSEAYNGGTALAVGTVITLNSAFSQAGATYLVYGQVSYTFTPLGLNMAVNAITLNASELLTPRNAAQVTINWGS